jgi:hypothetical protein
MSGGQRRTIQMTSRIVKDKERLGISIRMTSGIVKDKDGQGIAIRTKSGIQWLKTLSTCFDVFHYL